ncbi:hypothetical protein D3C85_1229280 [compost metagenome]
MLFASMVSCGRALVGHRRFGYIAVPFADQADAHALLELGDSKRLHTDSSVVIELRMVDTLRHRPHNRPDIAMWNDTGDAFRILRQTDRDAEPASDFDTEVRELRAEWIQFDEPEAAR